MKKQRTKEEIQIDVTQNYILLADFVVRKTGPIKNYGQFSEPTGLSSSNFSAVLKGTRSVPMECAVKACELYECSYAFMFGSLGEMFGKDDVMRRVLNLEERILYLEKTLGVNDSKKQAGKKSGKKLG